MDKLFCKTGGCTAKLGAAALKKVLGQLERHRDPRLLVGFDAVDDAAVFQLREDLALVHTTDFFPPMVEDPYIFGRIAAANAVSDVYAMGGEVTTALNLVSFPAGMDLNILGEILRGGAELLKEIGACLAGGHSIQSEALLYGLTVTGTVDPRAIWTNQGGQPGARLLLCKALGTGIACAAERTGQGRGEAFPRALASMQQTNKSAMEVVRRHRPQAVTDVTGFGLLGHLSECLRPGLGAILDLGRIPRFPEVLDLAEAFCITGAAQQNRHYVEGRVDFSSCPFAWQELLLDPQTSGGLLLVLDPEEVEACVSELRAAGYPAAEIGELEAQEGGQSLIRFRS